MRERCSEYQGWCVRCIIHVNWCATVLFEAQTTFIISLWRFMLQKMECRTRMGCCVFCISQEQRLSLIAAQGVVAAFYPKVSPRCFLSPHWISRHNANCIFRPVYSNIFKAKKVHFTVPMHKCSNFQYCSQHPPPNAHSTTVLNLKTTETHQQRNMPSQNCYKNKNKSFRFCCWNL